MSSVVWKDKGWKAISARVNRAGKTRVEVGLIGPEAQRNYPGRSDITIGEVGIINEYGTKDIPKRSFMRSVVRDPLEKSMILNWMFHATMDILLKERSADEALDRVGYRIAYRVKEKIWRTEGLEPNAPSTIKKKGFDHPLMHLGKLVEAVTHRLVRVTGDFVAAGAALGDYEAFEVSE